MFLSLKLALRFLFSHRLGSFSSYASWLAIGGLSIGVTALMLTASIIQGFQQVISDKLSSTKLIKFILSSDNFHLILINLNFASFESLEDLIISIILSMF